ncbi:hypothetical protein [uncultured Winogradskyella sp.]|uniref:hypothetical protein n=1 Tax=uncultured Winogradskyella sp. TaxID=395353 RepID=UPI0030D7BEA6|tara:strand:- start:140483 stop:141220 length:738 start_codon:yes stop_codon:yes gene_type:complete
MIQERIIDSLKQENESILKVVDSLKIQHQIDKLAYKVDTQNSIINEVNSFYDSAWIKLILVITILGIIVPVIVQYFQRKNFKDLAEDLKDKFDSKIENLKKDNEDKINVLIKTHKKKIKRNEKRNKKAMIELDAVTFHLQARSLFNEKNFFSSFRSYLKSSLLFKRSNRIDRIEPNLNNILLTLTKLNDEDFEKVDGALLETSEKKTFDECLSVIEEGINSDSVIISKIKEIREFIKEKTVPNTV